VDIHSRLAAVEQRIAQIAESFGLPPDPDPDRPGQASFEATLGSAEARVTPKQVERLIVKAAQTWRVDPALVEAVIANESGFDARATSSTGAAGLMQLEPGTAAALGVRHPYDPNENITGGTRYIRGLLERFHGDIRRAVAAYNAGPAAVEQYNGIPPYAETQNYVQKVLASYAAYRARRSP
jgi:soluble lytic murein transglycosylase-like protein